MYSTNCNYWKCWILWNRAKYMKAANMWLVDVFWRPKFWIQNVTIQRKISEVSFARFFEQLLESCWQKDQPPRWFCIRFSFRPPKETNKKTCRTYLDCLELIILQHLILRISPLGTLPKIVLEMIVSLGKKSHHLYKNATSKTSYCIFKGVELHGSTGETSHHQSNLRCCNF